MMNCFVIMPIKREGTPEHEHFIAIYKNIKSIIEALGYEVKRADDIQTSGAITKDIIVRLGTADLVIADLTDLNPNVFYELGVRHALRGTGTIMVLDEKRTEEIPFDLGSYRVLKYRGDLTGINQLADGLKRFALEQIADNHSSSRDNPVHDWFPVLPINLIEEHSKSKDAVLRKANSELQERLKRYEKTFGLSEAEVANNSNPMETILDAISDAEDGILPNDIMNAMRDAFDKRNTVTLLQKIKIVVERNVRVSPQMVREIAYWVSLLDIPNVTRAIYEYAMTIHPDSDDIKRFYYSTLSRSHLSTDREKARNEILGFLNIDLTNKGKFDNRTLDDKKKPQDLILIGSLLDAYHYDSLNNEALELTTKLIEKFPQSPTVVRNHGRALKKAGKDGYLEWYKNAATLPDATDTDALWLGSEMHNSGQYREACECYSLACMRDETDTNNFANLVDDMSITIANDNRSAGMQAVVPIISLDEFAFAVNCTVSCENYDQNAAETIRRSLARLEAVEVQPVAVGRGERLKFAGRIYSALQSNLTKPFVPEDQ